MIFQAKIVLLNWAPEPGDRGGPEADQQQLEPLLVTSAPDDLRRPGRPLPRHWTKVIQSIKVLTNNIQIKS